MRTVNFRDSVLHAIAYKLGLDPEVSLLKNQAYALASYINSYVRRLHDAADFPEWTVIGRFSVQTAPGLEHIVNYNAVPIEFIQPPMGVNVPDAPAPVAAKPMIGKVLKVYLVDPRTTWAPVDTPFRLEHVGIHCGFEHGNSVWIKYVTRCPQFTAREWDLNIRYDKDALTYSPVSGECYKSKSSNNLGHDPSQPGGTSGPLLPPMVEETAGSPDNPGLSAKTEIVDILAAAGSPTAIPIPDPPVAGTVFTIVIHDAADVFVGDATHTASGSESLATIFTNLQGQLVAEPLMSTFTVTLVTSPLKITLENASQFSVFKANYTVAIDTVQLLPLKVAQTQTYVAATAPAPGIGQAFKLTITDDQVVAGMTYTLTFTTSDSVQHVAAYAASATDSAVQVLSGLINSVIALQGTDDFFMGVSSILDTVSPSATFTIAKTLGIVSLHADIMQVGSTFWEIIPFPFDLVDQVVDGAYAESLKEGGQTDKGAAEQQLVPIDQQVRTAGKTGAQFDALTDQQKPTSRYAIK